MAGKVNTIMATEIALNASQPEHEIKNLQRAVNVANKAIQANSANFRAAGDAYKSAQAKAEGLNTVMDKQQDLIDKLSKKMQQQAEDAKNQAKLTDEYSDKIKELRKSMREIAKENPAGKQSQEWKDAKDKLTAFQSRLREVKNADTNLLRTSNQLANAQSKMARFRAEQARASREANDIHPTGWSRVSHALEGVNDRMNRVQEKATSMKSVLMGTFAGNALSNAASSVWGGVKTGIEGAIGAGVKFNIEQEKMIATWTTLTGNRSDANGMVKTIQRLSTKTGQAIGTVNELEQSFYHLHSSKKEADGMTSAMLNMADAVGLNSQQIEQVSQDMVHGMATGKITQGELNQIGQYFPMIDEAMAKHYHTNVKGMRQMAKAGKISAKGLEDVMEQLGNGKYSQAADNMMGTTFGMIRTLKSQLPMLLGDATKSSMNVSNPVLKMVSQWSTDKRTETVFQRMGKKLNAQMNSVLQAFMGGKSVSQAQVNAKLNGIVNGVTNIITRLGQFLAQHATKIKQVMSIVGSAFKIGFEVAVQAGRDVIGVMAKVAKALNIGGTAKKNGSALKTVASALKAIAKNRKAIKLMADTLLVLFATKKALGFISVLWRLRGVFKSILSVARTAATAIRLVGTALKVVSALAVANPIGATIAVIAGLGFAFYEAYKHIKVFRDMVNKAWKAIKKFFAHPIKSLGKFFDWASGGDTNSGVGRLATGSSGTTRDQIAIVNDAQEDKWRESMFYKNRLYPLPAKRNMMMFVPHDAQVINGQATDTLMKQRGVMHYANGTASNNNNFSMLNIYDQANAQQGMQAERAGIQSSFVAQGDRLNALLAQAQQIEQRAINLAKQKAQKLIKKAQDVLNAAVQKAELIQKQALAKAQQIKNSSIKKAQITRDSSIQKANEAHKKREATYTKTLSDKQNRLEASWTKSHFNAEAQRDAAEDRINKRKNLSAKQKRQKIQELLKKYEARLDKIDKRHDDAIAKAMQVMKKSKTKDLTQLAVETSNAKNSYDEAIDNANTKLQVSTMNANKALGDSKYNATQTFNDSKSSAMDEMQKAIDEARKTYNDTRDQIQRQQSGTDNRESSMLNSLRLNHYANGTKNNGVDHDQVAMVNDGAGSNWQEIMEYRGHLIPFPRVQNMLAYLPKGAQILNGEASNKFMQSVNHFASGTGQLNSYINNLNDAGADSHRWSYIAFVKKLKAEVAQQLKQIREQLIELTKELQEARKTLQKSLAKAKDEYNHEASDALQEERAALASADAQMRHAKDASAIQAANQAHQEAINNYLNAMNQAKKTEQNSDTQAQDAFNAVQTKYNSGQKLAQVNKNRLNDWYNDNVAQMRQGMSEFANGGIADRPSVFGENGAEMAIPLDSMKRGRAWNLLAQTVSMFNAQDSQSQGQQQVNDAQLEKAVQGLNKKFDQLLTLAGQLVNGQSVQTQAVKGINGYDASTAFSDFSANFRNAQASNLTY